MVDDPNIIVTKFDAHTGKSSHLNVNQPIILDGRVIQLRVLPILLNPQKC